VNFAKSLDHLSFIFKQVQRAKSKKSAMEDEIKRIEAQNSQLKSFCELKGGNSSVNEFYCTYTSLNMGVNRVLTDTSLADPAILTDFPINMQVTE
jgi:hypothetical protein